MPEEPENNRRIVVLERAVENTNEAFVTIDSHHRVVFFNKAAERIFGFDRQDVMGRDLDVIMAPSCSRDHRTAVARYLATRVPHRIGHDTEIVATRKNGQTFPANISFSVSEVDGETYFTGIIRDLSETKALQERILHAERLAALGQFVAEITHEIKNPLMMIGGFARQLAKETEDEKALSKLDIIAKEVARLEGLLNEFRDLYAPKNLDLELTDMNALVREVFDLVQENCKARDLHLEFQPAPETMVVSGDRARLKQVLLNLAKNAMEALQPGGRLSLKISKNQNRVVVTVADNGCGIPEENQKRIFSPFFTTKTVGTGLGLSVSRGIVEHHADSHLTFESQPGKGTVFKLTMPLAGPPQGGTGGSGSGSS